jgi:hypothetical protein
MTGDAWLDEPGTPPLLRGLVHNPAVPVPVLLRLLETRPGEICAGLRSRPELPEAVSGAMLRHPSARIRGALAAHPAVDPRTRAVLLSDPEWKVRLRAFGRPGQRPLSDEVMVRLLAEVDDPAPDTPLTGGELVAELLHATGDEPRLIRLAAGHPRAGVRRIAAGFLHLVPTRQRRALLDDDDPTVRRAAAAWVAHRDRVMTPADLPAGHCHAYWETLHRRLSRELVDQVSAGNDVEAVAVVAANPSTPPDVVAALLRHPEPEVRRQLAERADLTAEQLIRLAEDPAAEVRTAVSVHPGLTERQRAGIDIDVTTAPGHGRYDHTVGPEDRAAAAQRFFLGDMALGLLTSVAAAAALCARQRRRGASLFALCGLAWLCAAVFCAAFVFKIAAAYAITEVVPSWFLPDQTWGMAFYLDALVVMAVGLGAPAFALVAALARMIPAAPA